MSLSRETLLFGVALIAFGIWVELAGFDGALYTYAGITLAALAFLGSVVAAMDGAAPSSETAGQSEQP